MSSPPALLPVLQGTLLYLLSVSLAMIGNDGMACLFSSVTAASCEGLKGPFKRPSHWPPEL